MFDRATEAVLALAPGQAPCCAMPATCWPHGRHGAAGLLLRAGAALRTGARRQTSVLEDAARRRWHIGARPTRTRASRDTRSPPDRGACALRVQPSRRAHTPNSPRVVSLPVALQSTQDDAERRRETSPSCRSSSTIVFESGAAHRRWPRGTGSAGRTWCPRGAQERRRWRRRGGCGSGRGVGEVASQRRLARLGALGAWASGRATRRPSEGARGLRGVTWVSHAFCSVLVWKPCSRVRCRKILEMKVLY
jgi:hypothetical protein